MSLSVRLSTRTIAGPSCSPKTSCLSLTSCLSSFLRIKTPARPVSSSGICLPIMLNNLIASHGFRRAVQYTGYLVMGCLILANLLMHPRLPPAKPGVAKPSPKEIFASTPYRLLVLGLFLTAWGLFFPIYYLQVGHIADRACCRGH